MYFCWNFDFKRLTFKRTIIFITENLITFSCFLQSHKFLWKKASKCTVESIFWQKKIVNKKVYWLKIWFYHNYRKMENIIWRIFSLIVMPPNCICFRQIIGLMRCENLLHWTGIWKQTKTIVIFHFSLMNNEHNYFFALYGTISKTRLFSVNDEIRNKWYSWKLITATFSIILVW